MVCPRAVGLIQHGGRVASSTCAATAALRAKARQNFPCAAHPHITFCHHPDLRCPPNCRTWSNGSQIFSTPCINVPFNTQHDKTSFCSIHAFSRPNNYGLARFRPAPSKFADTRWLWAMHCTRSSQCAWRDQGLAADTLRWPLTSGLILYGCFEVEGRHRTSPRNLSDIELKIFWKFYDSKRSFRS